MKTRFEDPVLVDLLTGEVYGINHYEERNGAAYFAEIPLTDYPMVIIENSEIQYK